MGMSSSWKTASCLLPAVSAHLRCARSCLAQVAGIAWPDYLWFRPEAVGPPLPGEAGPLSDFGWGDGTNGADASGQS